MAENNPIPFPQADDLRKVIVLLNVNDDDKFQDKKALSTLLGDISDRQVQYYISACQYLGLISADKRFTDLGDMEEAQKNAELAVIIISKEIFGMVYFLQKSLGEKYQRDDVIALMREQNLGLNNDEVINRRAQTVMKWVEWINDNFDN